MASSLQLSGSTYKIQVLGRGKGRGMLAATAMSADQGIVAAAPDITVLYSPFAGKLCARCFTDITVKPLLNRQVSTKHSQRGKRGGLKGNSKRHEKKPLGPYICPTCDQYVLCGACHSVFADAAAAAAPPAPVEPGSRAPNCTARAAKPERGDPVPCIDEYQLAAHALACAWYNELPKSVTSPGQDTDYLRFCLHYAAVVQSGGEQLRESIQSLVSNADVQSAEVLSFCENFATNLVVKSFGPHTSSLVEGTPRYTISATELQDVLLRIRCNTLGFPFSAKETLGWSLQATLCMVNHSCTPNAAVVSIDDMDERKHFFHLYRNTNSVFRAVKDTSTRTGLIGLKAIRPITAGEEITISYVDLLSLESDVIERSRQLLAVYRFLCQCELCTQQRIGLTEK